VALPGDLYQRAGQWWWRVKLPGENKTKARPVKEPGAKEAVSDRDTAEKAAVEMWEHAVMQYGARQIALECSAKVERLKAQFLDKVRQLTDIVNTATAKAEAEEQARAEAEAKLNAILQAADQKTASPPASTPVEEEPCPAPTEAPVPVGEIPCPSMPCAPPETAEPSVSISDPQPSEEARPAAQAIVFDAAETVCAAQPAHSTEVKDRDPQAQVGVCECCGAMDIPTTNLARIDSGQRLCLDCLRALHFDIARIEASTPADDQA